MKKSKEMGRSMVEMIIVLVLLSLITLGGVVGFKKATMISRTNTMKKDISTAITERRYLNSQGGNIKPHKLSTKVGSTDLTVENITTGEKAGKAFTVLVSGQNKDMCEELKSFNLFSSEGIEVNTDTTGECSESNNDVKLYFDNTNPSTEGTGESCGKYTTSCCATSYDAKGCITNKRTPCPSGKFCKNCACQECPKGESPAEEDKECYSQEMGENGCPGVWTKKPDYDIDPCNECKDGKKQPKAKGTIVSECTQCDGNGGIENKPDDSIDDCNECISGVKTPKAKGTSVADCTQCDGNGGTETKSDGANPDGEGKCCKGGTMQEDFVLCSTCKIDQQYDVPTKSCVCRTNLTEPKETEVCSESNCCATGLECANGYCCPPGQEVETTFTGEKKCYRLCEEDEKPIGIIFLYDNSSSLTENFDGTTVLEQIKLSVNNTEIPNGIQYAVYRTDESNPQAFFSDYGGNSVARNIANNLNGHSYGSRFNEALKHIANNICSNKQKLLLIMYTDGYIDLNPDMQYVPSVECGYFNTEPGIACDGLPWYSGDENATGEIAKKCQSGTKLFITTYDSNLELENLSSRLFRLNQTERLNEAITKYLDDNYCIRK